MAAVFATGWTAALTADLSTTATILPLRTRDVTRLCNILGSDDHTYLVLTNGVDTEVVHAECSGSNVVIERGDTPIAVPSGGCVRFEVTADLLADYVTPNESVCEIVNGGGLTVEQDGCVVTLTLGEGDCEEIRWRSGNTEYWFEDGCIQSAPVTDGGCNLVPGTYRNATITVNAQGMICAIEAGSNIVYADNPCCADCGDDEE